MKTTSRRTETVNGDYVLILTKNLSISLKYALVDYMACKHGMLNYLEGFDIKCP